jgi:uncharacterized membrane protein YfcA
LTPLLALRLALGGVTAFFAWSWWSGTRQAGVAADAAPEALAGGVPSASGLAVGFVTNFFDTLGIGSYAPTTSAFKFFRMVPDRLIPGTLTVGHTPPVIVQALIYTAAIDVDSTTLVLMIAAAVAGAWLGAGIVAGLPKRQIQIGMGFALLVAAALFAWRNLGGGGTEAGTIGLEGIRLALGLTGNFALGALMTLGIGMYAPCMILIGLLGMNAAVAFPIMMGSCAFLMPVATARFVGRHAYALRPALGLAIGGLPGVLIAAYLVTSLDIYYLRWLVVGVVTIAAVMMLRSAAVERA